MFATILPGLREVRTSVSVGALWLIFLALLAGPRVSSFLDDAPIEPWMDSMVSTIGVRVGLVTVLGVLAYLVGDLVVVSSLNSSVLRIFEGMLRIPKSSAAESAYTRHVQELQSQCDAEARLLLADPSRDGAIEIAAGATLADHRDDALVMAPGLFAEYDRRATEAEYRINLAPPLLAIGVYGGISWFWLILLTVFPIALILRRGLLCAAEARGILLRAVVHDAIRHPLAAIRDQIREVSAGESASARAFSAWVEIGGYDQFDDEDRKGATVKYLVHFRNAHDKSFARVVYYTERLRLAKPDGSPASDEEIRTHTSNYGPYHIDPGRDRVLSGSLSSILPVVGHIRGIMEVEVNFYDDEGRLWLRGFDGSLSRALVPIEHSLDYTEDL